MLSLTLLLALSPLQDAPSRTQAWQTDLDFFAQNFKSKHIRPFAHIKEADFDQAISDIKDNLANLTDHQVVIQLQQLLGRVGDGHSHLAPPRTIAFQQYPLGVTWLADGWYVFAIDEKHKHLLKSKLTMVGTTPVDEATKRLATLFANENISAERTRVQRALVNVQALHALGLINNPKQATYTFEKSDGKTEIVTFAPLEQPGGFRFAEALKQVTFPPHLAQRRPQHGFVWLDESKTLYVWYDRCVDNPNLPIAAWTKTILQEIDDKSPEKVIIDLRRNGGGNSILLWPLKNGIKNKSAINTQDKLFILIGPGTYSSAMLNAFEFRRDTKAQLVGQPTGGSPNSPGEVKTFTLPHSKCIVQYSTKLFRMTKDGATTIKPDIEVNPTAELFFHGKDEVLDAVLKK